MALTTKRKGKEGGEDFHAFGEEFVWRSLSLAFSSCM